jgi:hypothetical protein
MVTIFRSVVLLSAVVAVALGVAFEANGSRAANPSAAAQVAERFPLAGEILTPVPITTYVAQKFIAAQKAAQKATQKSHRPRASESCASTPNGWPYVSHDCLVASDGTRVPTLLKS